MRRVLSFVILLAPLAYGQQPVVSPFAPPGPDQQPWEQGGLEGAGARFAETLALMEARIKTDPADVVALERACTLLDRMGRKIELIPFVREQRFDPTSIITHRLPLAEGPNGYTMFDRKQDGCIKIILEP